MDGEFRIGIVGAGMICRNAHLPACIATPGVNLTALIDPDTDRAAALAREHSLNLQVAESLDSLSAPVDGVIIASPNHTHADLAIACISRGIHTLIEKPLGRSGAEAERVAVCHREHPEVTAAVGFCMRYWPSIEYCRELLKAGPLGPVHHVLCQYGARGGWAPVSNYNLDRRTAGGGVMMNNGIHYLDRLCDWFGCPQVVSYQDDGNGGPEANAVALLEFDAQTPFRASVRMSKTCRFTAGTVVRTERGEFIHRDWRDPIVEVRLEGRSLRPEAGDLHLESRPDPFALQLQSFIGNCRKGTEPRATINDGVRACRLLDALYACRRPLDEDWYGDGAEEGA